MRVARLAKQIDRRWLALDPVRLGPAPAGRGTPDSYACVEDEDACVLRADLYLGADELRCFQEATVWQGFAVIGFGARVHLVDIETRATTSTRLPSYFGEFLCLPQCLLVASGENVVRVEPDGHVLWASAPVAIDGVVLGRVERGLIEGNGEWDPPGGWKPFRLRLADGTVLHAGS